VTSIAQKLAGFVEERPNSFFVVRQPSNYSLFLRLYQEVGYAPSEAADLLDWQERSRSVWRSMDQALPGTYTGGLVDDTLVSAAGTLPLSTTAIYGHSFCMLKRPEAAVTLYAQSLESLRWMNHYRSEEYWVGSYGCHSRFVTLFQRPVGMSIPGQLEIEVLLCFPLNTSTEKVEPNLVLEEIAPADGLRSLQDYEEIFSVMASPHPALKKFHSIRIEAVKDKKTGEKIAVALIQDVPRELTAFNVYSWTWIFPTGSQTALANLCNRLRTVEDLKHRPLNIAHKQSDIRFVEIPNEKLIPRFWAFTPRKQVPLLRESFRAAFLTLFNEFTEEEATNVLRFLESQATHSERMTGTNGS
jgi:hypothetical protein